MPCGWCCGAGLSFGIIEGAAGAANALRLGVWGQADGQRDTAAFQSMPKTAEGLKRVERHPDLVEASDSHGTAIVTVRLVEHAPDVAQRVVTVSALGRGRLSCLVFRAHFGVVHRRSYLTRFHFRGGNRGLRGVPFRSGAPSDRIVVVGILGLFSFLRLPRLSSRREQRQLIFGEPFAAGASRYGNLNSRWARRPSLRSAPGSGCESRRQWHPSRAPTAEACRPSSKAQRISREPWLSHCSRRAREIV